MQFTAFNMLEIHTEKPTFQFYIYELTKTFKVVKYRVEEILPVADCVMIIIGDGKTIPVQRLLFLPNSGTKRQIGESIYYTDFGSIKSRLNDKNSLNNLKKDIHEHERILNDSINHLNSKKDSLERLKNGLNDDYLRELEMSDKKLKGDITVYLKNNLFESAQRYGADISFTFLIDRLWNHFKDEVDDNKQTFIIRHQNWSNEELNKLLTEKISQNVL